MRPSGSRGPSDRARLYPVTSRLTALSPCHPGRPGGLFRMEARLADGDVVISCSNLWKVFGDGAERQTLSPSTTAESLRQSGHVAAVRDVWFLFAHEAADECDGCIDDENSEQNDPNPTE